MEAMTLNLGSTQRPSVWCSWCRQVFLQEKALPTPTGLLRRFLLLKQVTVLLSPQGAVLPLLAGCWFSLKALVLLRSPHISTKPSSVFLGQLALAGLLPLPYLALWLALTTLDLLNAEAAPGRVNQHEVCTLAERLLDAHLLASLLLLGLLGLEGVLVSRWAPQTRGLRTARYAQLGCRLVWVLVLMELLLLVVDVGWTVGAGAVTPPDGGGGGFGVALPSASIYLRRALWIVNVGFHYCVTYNRPQKRDSCFH